MTNDSNNTPKPDNTPSAASSGGERIAKVIARSGVASRRDAEKLILAGRVAVNGKQAASPALDVTPKDKVTIDGTPIDAPQETRVWLYYKPLGLVTTEKDEQGRRTIFDEMPEGMPRVLNVGRLDLNSEGLLLLTNDGALKRRLELPETGWLRKYRVRVNGRPTPDTFNPLRAGITIDGTEFQPMDITLDRQQGANAWLTVGLREGKNREIRRAMAEIGLTVNRLIRVSYGPFRLNEMQPGDVMEIKRRVLHDQLGSLLEDTPGAQPADRNKPAGRRDDGERPRGRFGERGDRGERGGKRFDRAPRDNEDGRGDGRGKPERSFGRQKDFSARGDRPERGDRFERADRGPRAEGEDRPRKQRWSPDKRQEERNAPREDRADRPRRDGDDRKFGDRKFGDKKFGDRPRRDGGEGRSFGEKKFGERSERGERGDRKFGDRKFGERDDRGGRTFGDKKFGERKFGDKKFEDRGPRGDGKSFGKPRREEGEARFGDKPRKPRFDNGDDRGPRRDGNRDGGNKPRSFGGGDNERGGFKGGPKRDGQRGERNFGGKPGASKFGGKSGGGFKGGPKRDGQRGDGPKGPRKPRSE
ncbi:pseudouridine synthase [Thioclava litoralis]|uniref:Pseudouridine synthase n=1 Tax=Thioclava litoralis TaxID=3076557 RepID=A0ABZ1DZK0_9RHOB|nr:pseudouridine synthase [Thioclava sp. FTW29]